MKKFFCAIFLFQTACHPVLEPATPVNSDYLVIVESNTPWTGKIDTFTVRGDSIHWFRVTRPTCWTIQKTSELGMVRVYATTLNFQYGWRLEEQKYPMWDDGNTTSPFGQVQGCHPGVVR